VLLLANDANFWVTTITANERGRPAHFMQLLTSH